MGYGSTSSYPVALPRRGGAAQDRPASWPEPFGGATGVVAEPGRLQAADGSGVAARPTMVPPLDGARGAVARFVRYISAWNWADPATRAEPTPIGWADELRVRDYAPNIAAISAFAAPQPGPTSWTANAAGDERATRAVAPIPFSRRRVDQTWRHIFDSRLWTLYMPHPQIQQPQNPRRQLAGVAATQTMRRPFFPFLTRQPGASSYGALATVVGGQRRAT